MRICKFDFRYARDFVTDIFAYPEQSRAVHPWLRNPPAFPTFAEFSEQIDVPEHVDDTGQLFRAFLPFQDAASRENISQYSGKALVLDARVSCQRPQIEQLYLGYGDPFYFSGNFSKTADVPALLGPAASVPFNYTYDGNLQGYSLTLCQPSGLRYGDGKLLSKLRDDKQWSRIAEGWSNGSLTIDDRPNAAYLIFDSTQAGWPANSKDRIRDKSSISGHGAWTDVSYLTPSPSYPYADYLNVSVTLCYPASWSARLNITAHSPHNRTEPGASSFKGSFQTEPDIHGQMGEFKHDHEKAALKSRGTLSLARKDSWLPDPADALQYDTRGISLVDNSFIARAAQIPSNPLSSRFDNSSLSWGYYEHGVMIREHSPDSTIASIFATSLQITNGSAATALSTIITILTSMAYYDQFPSFTEIARDVSTTYFQPFLFPRSFRGFTAVLVITCAHYFLVFLVVAVFVISTRLSTLGDHWQTISQIISPATEDFLKKSSLATDKEVHRGLKADDRDHEMVNLQVLAEDGGKIGLVARKSHRRSSHDVGLE